MRLLPLSLTALALLTATSARAEDRLCFLGGATFSKLQYVDSPDKTTSGVSTGYLGGAFLQFGMAPGFYIEPQVRYNEKGNGETKVQYVEGALYAKYKVQGNDRFMPHIFAGPNVGFKIGTEGPFGSERYKDIDVAIDAGLGADYPLDQNLNLSLSASYSFGLVDVAEPSVLAAPAINTTGWKSRGFNVYAGLSFALN